MLSTKDTFLLIIVNMKYFKLTHNSKFNKKFKYKLNQSLEPAITKHFIRPLSIAYCYSNNQTKEYCGRKENTHTIRLFKFDHKTKRDETGFIRLCGRE